MTETPIRPTADIPLSERFVQIQVGKLAVDQGVTVTGERLAPGLVLVPSINPEGHLDEFWNLVHETSGRPFTGWGIRDHEVIRQLAWDLSSAGGDWTVPFDQFSPEMMDAAREALTAAYKLVGYDVTYRGPLKEVGQ